ncbi:Ribosomal RNA large subunit methyltransferase I [Caulifigura coniformis]|uniref:Ribosomal RNA large subunit methyltransferase I n=1 Tax=Caulifigura coniformis TaxID=2527983 RepID=A0A517SH21_9PLAN|nr:class I SAM-dependent rRNA methyltransferase [Caulifigura coniformis]QDT55426.1 Ribosomal RNA large subunit methyltransferase I [Caulifigura coniformis]
MSQLLHHSPRLIRLTLARDLVRSVRSGHPWVYRDALRDVPQAQPGSVAELFASDGRRRIATGMYDPGSPVAFRVCQPEGGRVDDEWASRQLERAVHLRQSVTTPQTTGYRLSNGEGDGLPGLVIDLYGTTGVLKLDGSGPEGFWNAAGIGEWLLEKLSLKGVVCRTRGEEGAEVVAGDPDVEPEFLEHGLKFTSNVQKGQKTGFFLDQRENRRIIRDLSAGKTVLNLFSYTGGFSIAAGVGGARKVTSVDSAGPAVAICDRHWRMNGLEEGNHTSIATDAFEFLEQTAGQGRRWDIVIVDPPSFAPSAKSVERAKGAYQKLMTAAAKVVEPGGLLAASSCSSHISESMFLEILVSAMSQSRRRARVAAITGQPVDHPWPLVCPELRYLKFVLLELN